MTNLRTELRKHVRKKRQSLTPEEQSKAADQVLALTKSLDLVHNSQHIALYLTADGELDTFPLIHYLWQQGKQVYLPILHPFSSGHLLFLHYQPSTQLVTNKHGILEPKLKKESIIPIAQLDIIFTPLVAFDHLGHRLGMGGGYYDRSLEGWFKTQQGAVPIGLAHDCQRVDQLATESWDIPLPKIITPSGLWEWESKL